MKELLDNVSLFWSKYFKDKDILSVALEGALTSIASSYMDSASCILSKSIATAPLTLEHDLVLLELLDSNFLLIDNILLYDLGETDIRSIRYISPSPNSDLLLENEVDFILLTRDQAVNSLYQLKEGHRYLVFNEDPRQDPRYRVSEEDAVGRYRLVVLDDSIDMVSLKEALPYPTVVNLVDISSTSNSITVLGSNFLVVDVDTDLRDIILDVSTPVTFAADTCKLELSTGEQVPVRIEQFEHVDAVTMAYAHNCTKDTYFLRDNFGASFSRKDTESTESYRNYLLGMSLLRTAPFSSKVVKAAVCLTNNIPVFLEDYSEGSRIIRVLHTPKSTTVVTSEGTYEIPKELTVRPEIIADAYLVETMDESGALTTNRDESSNPSFTQSLRFKPLDSFISDISILSQKNNQDWWNRDENAGFWLELPEFIMQGEPRERRLVINSVHANLCGPQDPLPPAACGDYNLQVGADTRNTVAFSLYKDFVQHHLVFVQLSEAMFTRSGGMDSLLFSDLRSELVKNCTPGTLIYLSPGLDIAANLPDINQDGIPDILEDSTYSSEIL